MRSASEAEEPVTPFQWCRVAQLTSRRRTVASAWEPSSRNRPLVRRARRFEPASHGSHLSRAGRDSKGDARRDKFQRERLWYWPGQRITGRGLGPGREIGEIGGEGA